jgi:hypothetical protein
LISIGGLTEFERELIRNDTGTPEYDEMMAKREQEAARPKTEPQQPK